MDSKVVLAYHDFSCQIISIEQIKNNLQELNISTISISEDMINEQSNTVYKYTDLSHPLVLNLQFMDMSNQLLIDLTWYEQNKQVTQDLLNYICSNVNRSNIRISSSKLINDDLIDSICKNESFDFVDLGRINDIYTLTLKDYEKFKSTQIGKVYTFDVCDELKDNFDSLIEHNQNISLISGYTYSELKQRNYIFLTEQLTSQELNNLQYLDSDKKIVIRREAINDLKSIYNRLKELNKKNLIELTISDKEEVNEIIMLDDTKYENVVVNYDSLQQPISIEQYKSFETILYQMIEPAEYLSPFEKYIYAYNIVKQFKEYNQFNDTSVDNEVEAAFESRDLYKILMNEYIVCVGFSNLFSDLLNKLKIGNTKISVDVDTSYDDKEELSDLKLNKEQHSRVYSNIVDEKYDIDGFYIADPTWDNDLQYDYYNYLVMTDNEVNSNARYLYFNHSNVNEVFNIKNLQEFYSKINFILDRRKYNNDEIYLVFEEIVNRIKFLDLKEYEKLIEKYTFLTDYHPWPKDLTDIAYDLGIYICKKVNKEISGDIIMRAVEEVYRHSYGYTEEQLKDVIEEVRERNIRAHNNLFPKRYKENNDKTEVIYENEINKFEKEKNVKVK